MPQNITIELFPAGNGDAILLDIGGQIILIDAGYTSTFRNHLKPRLKQLHNEGRLVSKFIITHIDADHISGAIAFIKENGHTDNPAIIGIDEIWFNSYRHLVFEDKEEGHFEGEVPNIKITGGLESVDANDEEQLVSYPQGTTLGSQIMKNSYKWNTSFKGFAVKADNPIKLNLGDGLELTLLGPTQESLDDMAKYWYKYLRKRFNGSINEDNYFDDAFELMMEEMRQADIDVAKTIDNETLVSIGDDWVEINAVEWEKEDTSPTNGSSITFLLEYAGKKLLFLGDAIPSQLENQLKKLAPETEFPLKIDVLKVAHHGAWPNNSPKLLKMIQATNYLFSSSGSRHHHPNFETMAWILKSHNKTLNKTLVFNYKQGNRLLDIDDSLPKQKYNYKVIWPHIDEWGNGVDGYIKLTL